MTPKRYKLKRDLPTFKAGDEFVRYGAGALVQIRPNGIVGVVAYTATTLKKFPNILTDWFEEIKEPLIKDEKIRKAVRAWAEACGIVSCYLECGEFATKHREIDCCIGFGDTTNEMLEEKHYTIAELCGDSEEEE